MKRFLLFISSVLILTTSCIQDAPLSPEADILSFSFPQDSLRIPVIKDAIYNDYIVVFPKKDVNLKSCSMSDCSVTVTPGATWEYISNPLGKDTLFYIRVESEDKQYTKTYSIIQINELPKTFDFENWIQPTTCNYEIPAVGSLRWYSSNTGVSTLWCNSKTREQYPVRSISINGNKAVELETKEGFYVAATGKNMPCIAGSLFLGDFDIMTGLTNPLRSTKFGVPFNSGKPLRFSGDYIYKEGSGNYLYNDNNKTAIDNSREDICQIYAVLFKVDENNPYLYGDNISVSPNIIARAEVKHENIVQIDDFTHFDVPFAYTYPTLFKEDELYSNKYKLTIVFASGKRGAYYEGRLGNKLIIDNVQLHY